MSPPSCGVTPQPLPAVPVQSQDPLPTVPVQSQDPLPTVPQDPLPAVPVQSPDPLPTVTSQHTKAAPQQVSTGLQNPHSIPKQQPSLSVNPGLDTGVQLASLCSQITLPHFNGKHQTISAHQKLILIVCGYVCVCVCCISRLTTGIEEW